jgi:HPt (histidine-containing phosphotransfer) domain-containing protein
MSQRDVYMRHGFDECLLKPVSIGQFRRLLIRWNMLGLKDDIAVDEASKTDAAALQKANGQSALPPAVDKNAMAEMMGAFDESAVQMLHMFIDMTAPVISRIEETLTKGDAHALSELGHSLKGGARSACCPHLGDLAARLQDDSRDGKDCTALVQDISTEFIRVKLAVASMAPGA